MVSVLDSTICVICSGLYEECFGSWRYCFLVGGFLQLLQVGTCWAKDWSVVIRIPGKMYCWNDQGRYVCDQDLGPDYGPVVVLRFYKELQRALLRLGGWKMHQLVF